MTTIHMDVEGVRRLQRNLRSVQEHIAREIHPVNVLVNNLPLHWRSNSSREFMTEYEIFEGNMARVLEELGEIAEQIQEEADRWERMAQKF